MARLQVALDFVDTSRALRCAKEAVAGGADLLEVGTPLLKAEGLEAVRALHREFPKVPVVCDAKTMDAGRAEFETAAKAGASVVIVGGFINKASDGAAATRAVRKAMETGESVASDLFRRASGEAIRELLQKVSTPNISDGFHRQPCLEGIRPVTPGARCVGPAFTVRAAPGDWAKPVEAIDQAHPGSVLVIDAGGSPPALWGELATHSCIQRKIAGVVIDGAIRDTPEIRRLGFAAFARHIVSHAGEPKGFGEIGVPVRVGGQRVHPGDWIAGDDDGVLVLPKERAVEMANRAMDCLEKEIRIRHEIDDEGRTLNEVVELYKWEKDR